MFLSDLKQKIELALDLNEVVFTYPPQSELGDLSLACFDLAKERKKSPALISQELEKKLKSNKDIGKYFFEIKSVGPYLNFFIKNSYLANEVIKEIKELGDQYGFNGFGKGKGVMIEYSNGNTHKEYHVGHLRNISYGDAVARILKANGYNSIPVSYINDFGIHVAKTIWLWQRDKNYQNSSEDRGYLLGKCYADASKQLVDNQTSEKEVAEIMKEIESRSGDNYKFWQESRAWSIDYFSNIYKELHVSFSHIFYESELIEQGLKIVDDLKKKGILKLSQGAVIADLEEYALGVLPIIRSNGTALYAVADLALASEKFSRYKLSESIYVVDVRQSLYFKQLFKILSLMGYKQKLSHLTYDFVTLPAGMMSSRSGNVITYRELKNKVRQKLLKETKARHPDWEEEKINKVVLSLSISTIKFEMIKVGADRIITFDLDNVVRFDGYTACYLQYAYARLQSIINKGDFNFSDLLNLDLLQEEKEKRLLLSIARYPEIIFKAGEKYNPSELAKYLFELAQLSNDYYHETNILQVEVKLKRARLSLIKSVSQVLKNGFNILGLEALEEM